MLQIFKFALAILLGVFINVCVYLLGESIIQRFYPSNYINPTVEQVKNEISLAPIGAILLYILIQLMGVFFGTYTASRIAGSPYKNKATFAVGFVMLLFLIVFYIAYAFPLYLSILVCSLYLIVPFFIIQMNKKWIKNNE